MSVGVYLVGRNWVTSAKWAARALEVGWTWIDDVNRVASLGNGCCSRQRRRGDGRLGMRHLRVLAPLLALAVFSSACAQFRDQVEVAGVQVENNLPGCGNGDSLLPTEEVASFEVPPEIAGVSRLTDDVSDGSFTFGAVDDQDVEAFAEIGMLAPLSAWQSTYHLDGAPAVVLSALDTGQSIETPDGALEPPASSGLAWIFLTDCVEGVASTPVGITSPVVRQQHAGIIGLDGTPLFSNFGAWTGRGAWLPRL